jgi:sec-independent protein translocase protein TatA
MTVNFANGLGWPHLLIIAGVIVLLFGSKKLPDMARSLGQSARILKAETQGMRSDKTAQQTQPAVSAEPPPGELERLRQQLHAAELREKVANAKAAEQHLPNINATT